MESNRAEFEHNSENYFNDIIIEKVKNQLPKDMKSMHVHNRHELYFLLSGSRRYLIGKNIYQVNSGELVIVPKGEIHNTSCQKKEGYYRYVIYFSEELAENVRRVMNPEAFDSIFNGGCIQFPTVQRARIKALFETIEEELASKEPGAQLLAVGKLYEILVTAVRFGTPKSREADKTFVRIQEVVQYVNENYTGTITLHEAAQMVYLEDTYFSRQFKKFTGFGFVEYVNRVRAKEAAELLKGSDLSVSKIAECCGFSGSNYFGDVFRKLYGMSPLAYRKQFKGFFQTYAKI